MNKSNKLSTYISSKKSINVDARTKLRSQRSMRPMKSVLKVKSIMPKRVEHFSDFNFKNKETSADSFSYDA